MGARREGRRDPGPPRGILESVPGGGRFHHERTGPAPDLEHVVQHFWTVSWDLEGHGPALRETLPHPVVHVVIGENVSRVAGIAEGRFTRVLTGAGRVFGVKFRPGGFQPFVRGPVSRLTGREVPLADVFGPEGERLAGAILDAGDDTPRRIALAEEFLRERLPPPDPNVPLAASIVERVGSDRAILRVEDLAEWSGMSTRALQRLFSRYVGVGPKWVIRRYRLHEALELLAAGEPADWPAVALSLGYFDQAHFINDFKALVGRTPAEYARLVAGARTEAETTKA
ncbi:MAG: helix-turn-helix transcriptional regulator [Vicinamibacteria bacterium]